MWEVGVAFSHFLARVRAFDMIVNLHLFKPMTVPYIHKLITSIERC